MKKSTKTKTVQIRVEQSDYDRWVEVANRKGLNVSPYLRMKLKEAIQEDVEEFERVDVFSEAEHLLIKAGWKRKEDGSLSRPDFLK